MKKLGLLFLASIALLVVPGCYWLPISVAPSDTPLEGRQYTKLERIEVSDKKVRLLGFIPLSGNNRLGDALDKARKQSGGDALIDIVTEYHYCWFILISSHSDVVTATPIKFIDPVRVPSSPYPTPTPSTHGTPTPTPKN